MIEPMLFCCGSDYVEVDFDRKQSDQVGQQHFQIRQNAGALPSLTTRKLTLATLAVGRALHLQSHCICFVALADLLRRISKGVQWYNTPVVPRSSESANASLPLTLLNSPFEMPGALRCDSQRGCYVPAQRIMRCEAVGRLVSQLSHDGRPSPCQPLVDTSRGC